MAKDKDKDIVTNPQLEILRGHLARVKKNLEISSKLTKTRTKYAKEGSIMDYTDVLGKLEKLAFVPGDQLGQGMPVDPATGMPIDPATGMPIDPATGMPMDPAMMGGGGMPPMDPSMGGMPPVDPATGMPIDPATGMPIDPAMMMGGGGMPPMDPAMMGAAPPAPAPTPAEGTGTPATAEDIAVLEERMSGFESILEDLVDTIDALGGKTAANTAADAKAAEAAPEVAPAVMPGPLGGGAGAALGMIRPNPTGNPDVLNNLMGRLSELRGA